MYRFFRPLIFKINPETAHKLTLALLRLAGLLPGGRELLKLAYRGNKSSPVLAFGLKFNNPIGLAAGYDKDALVWRELACLGFGHIEVGTVTPQPQAGNPKPRIFRLPEGHALINRLGFPGRGAEYVSTRLSGPRPLDCILGVNLGKNKTTPNEYAVKDYVNLVRTFAPLADYLVVNVSSPNTEGLRQLQARKSLDDLLGGINQERETQSERLQRRVPLLVKLSPDLTDAELDDALDVILGNGMDGVIATNTTISRKGLHSLKATESGGLSGAPLRTLSTDMVRKVFQRTEGKLTIIGVGGVQTPTDVKKKLDAGAVLVQIYTGLVYQGPGLAKRLVGSIPSRKCRYP